MTDMTCLRCIKKLDRQPTAMQVFNAQCKECGNTCTTVAWMQPEDNKEHV